MIKDVELIYLQSLFDRIKKTNELKKQEQEQEPKVSDEMKPAMF